MPDILNQLDCPDCGAPLKVKAGEAIVTCGYCGSDVNMAVGTKYFLRHSIIPPKIKNDSIDSIIKGWMGRGFLKPGDLARKYKVISKELQVLPLFIVHTGAKSAYEGTLTRTGTPESRKGVIEKEYYWAVLGRRASTFPTREYKIPLAAKVDFDISAMTPEAKFLNSEIDDESAVVAAKQQIEVHHRFLVEKEIDEITRFDTKFEIKDTEFVHVPAWFITYDYRGKIYNLILDGATGEDIKAEIPQEEKKGFLGSLFGG
jgi:hypothetical protein